ncbi:conserved hypothetical protein [Vibrio chagasii]|nr:conserved hypothetical protein [Vibrio chagasii]
MQNQDIYNGPIWRVSFNDGFSLEFQRVFEPTKQLAIEAFEKSTGYKVIQCNQCKPEISPNDDNLSVEHAKELIAFAASTNYSLAPFGDSLFSSTEQAIEFVLSDNYEPNEALSLCFDTKQGNYMDSMEVTKVCDRWYAEDPSMGGRTVSGKTLEEMAKNIHDEFEEKDSDFCPVEIIASTTKTTNIYFWVSMTNAGSEALFKQDELNNLELISSFDEADDDESKADAISGTVEALASNNTVHNITLNAHDVYELAKVKDPELTIDDMGVNCIVEAAHQLNCNDKLLSSNTQ